MSQLMAANIEAEASGINDGEYHLTKHEFSSLGQGKYSECNTTESSDDIEKQELEEVSDDEETSITYVQHPIPVDAFKWLSPKFNRFLHFNFYMVRASECNKNMFSWFKFRDTYRFNI